MNDIHFSHENIKNVQKFYVRMKCFHNPYCDSFLETTPSRVIIPHVSVLTNLILKSLAWKNKTNIKCGHKSEFAERLTKHSRHEKTICYLHLHLLCHDMTTCQHHHFPDHHAYQEKKEDSKSSLFLDSCHHHDIYSSDFNHYHHPDIKPDSIDGSQEEGKGRQVHVLS